MNYNNNLFLGQEYSYMDNIFLLRHLMKEYIERTNGLSMILIDFEKNIIEYNHNWYSENNETIMYYMKLCRYVWSKKNMHLMAKKPHGSQVILLNQSNLRIKIQNPKNTMNQSQKIIPSIAGGRVPRKRGPENCRWAWNRGQGGWRCRHRSR